jgi:hypothetical protein
MYQNYKYIQVSFLLIILFIKFIYFTSSFFINDFWCCNLVYKLLPKEIMGIYIYTILINLDANVIANYNQNGGLPKAMVFFRRKINQNGGLPKIGVM